ncbi:hypothetical protein NDN08_002461 [Rhodosorus marinus]|uniref:Vitamin K epoxide reductase domain-containing protein n=1 Tax=Rhodosorus marinus TaxID=101924 RepID=A0AAV8UTS6_9RHOD|nr:hypothetical protein NDN08_002461 [Rhodosorus marinus]
MCESGPESSEGSVVPQESGLHELPRKILIGLSCAGLVETALLTYKKIFGGGMASLCSTAGCLEVLDGPYSSVFGIPLTLFGMGGYAAALGLGVYPLLASSKNDTEAREKATRGLLVTLASAMTSFSTYLMFVLVGVIQGWCPWCFFSAALSGSMGFLVLSSFATRWKTAVTTALVTLAGAAGIFVTTPGGVLDASTIRDPPAITTISSAEALGIADRLESKHTKMYGAFWCSHCFGQKQMLGKEAMEKIDYVECSERGRNSQSALCKEKKIAGYPAWEIDGKMFFGEQSMQDFDEILRTGGKANDPYADLLKEIDEMEKQAS